MTKCRLLILILMSFSLSESMVCCLKASEIHQPFSNPGIAPSNQIYKIPFDYQVKNVVGRIWKEAGKYGTEALPDVKIEIIAIDDQQQKYSTTSKSDGRFRICEVPEGDYSLIAEAEGYKIATGLVTVSSKASTTAQVVFPMFPKSSNIESVLEEMSSVHHEKYTWEDGGKLRGFTIYKGYHVLLEIDEIKILKNVKGMVCYEHPQIIGQPRNQEKIPLSGVIIELRGPDYTDNTLSVKTDEKGCFAFPNLDVGEYRFITRFEGFMSKTGIIKVSPAAHETDELIIHIGLE